MGQNHDVYALVSIVGICLHEPRVFVCNHSYKGIGRYHWFLYNVIVWNRILPHYGMVALGKWYNRSNDFYHHHPIVSKTDESLPVCQFYQCLARVGHVTDLSRTIYTSRRIVILSI